MRAEGTQGEKWWCKQSRRRQHFWSTPHRYRRHWRCVVNIRHAVCETQSKNIFEIVKFPKLRIDPAKLNICQKAGGVGGGRMQSQSQDAKTLLRVAKQTTRQKWFFLFTFRQTLVELSHVHTFFLLSHRLKVVSHSALVSINRSPHNSSVHH